MFQLHRRSKWQNILRYLVDFCSRSPFAGLGYLARRDIHWCEFLYWLLAICLMFTTGIFSVIELGKMYTSRNAAITLKVDYMHINTLYPSMTLCPQQILSDEKVESFLRSQIHLQSDEERRQCREFLQNLSLLSGRKSFYFNTSHAHISANNFMDIIFSLSEDYDVTFANQSAVKIMTEFGICYTINNFLQKEMYTKNWFDPFPYPRKLSERFVPSVKTFNFTNRYPIEKEIHHNISGNITIFLHSPYELPTTWWRPNAVVSGKRRVQMITSITDITYQENFLSETRVHERRCRAINESNLDMFPTSYSRNLCLMQCRAAYIKHICNCLPHFYSNRWAMAVMRARICGIRGLNCYAQHMKLFRNINANLNSMVFKCNCYPNCIEQVTVAKVKEPFSQCNRSSVVLVIEHPPTESYERSVMYKRSDYAVAIFSVMSTFMGFSVLSVIDCVYFFTIRIYWHRRGYRGGGENH